MLIALAPACGDPPPSCVPAAPPLSGPTGGSVVLVVLDDVGVDKVGAYGVHPRPAPTPNLDALAERGLRFVSAYSEPICSPGRAAILTGRRPIRTGMGTNVETSRRDLPDAEVLIPEALHEAPGDPWTSVAIGKWHLANLDARGLQAPLRQGFDHFDGLLGNPDMPLDRGGPEGDYFDWERVVDGVVSRSREYLVTAQADAAIEAVETLPEPFFLYVAFSGAHGPTHVPPDELWSASDPVDEPGTGDAMIEALDHELGRLVDAIGDRATVIVTSDNGTSKYFVRPPALRARAKVSVYSGGAHVPLIVAGPEVAPGTSDALVHATDLFPTVLDLAGVHASTLGLELDGTSLAPLFAGDAGEREPRRCLFVERFTPNGVPKRHDWVAVMDDRYELVGADHGRDELYRRAPLLADEGPDLLRGPLDDDARAALAFLREQRRRDL